MWYYFINFNLEYGTRNWTHGEIIEAYIFMASLPYSDYSYTQWSDIPETLMRKFVDKESCGATINCNFENITNREVMLIMHRNKLCKLLLLLLAFGFTVSLSVTVTAGISVPKRIIHGECYEIDCERCQIERLRELLYGEVVKAFNSDGEPINIPRVNFIIPPEGDRDYFRIGVFGMGEPTSECVDFILSHTGIPRERASIVRGVGMIIGGGDILSLPLEELFAHRGQSDDLPAFRVLRWMNRQFKFLEEGVKYYE